MTHKEEELEVSLLKQKVLIIGDITNCVSEKQLVKYIYELSKIYLEKERMDKYHKTDISPAKILKEH